jgi:hypothetical protein
MHRTAKIDVLGHRISVTEQWCTSAREGDRDREWDRVWCCAFLKSSSVKLERVGQNEFFKLKIKLFSNLDYVGWLKGSKLFCLDFRALHTMIL